MIIRDIATLRQTVRRWKEGGETTGLVPTMGALHEGHLSLVKQARKQADRVIVSIFVNPTQFNNPTDLATYPRTEEADIALLGDADAIFIPSVDTMYPAGFNSRVQVMTMTEMLEGAHRPGHFDGMATVVTKLFGITQADIAFFGEKDWQQLQIIRRFVQDLNISINIVACPTLREADGLAMSSRNRRLSPQARAIAPELHATLQETAAQLRAGTPVTEALAQAKTRLARSGFQPVDYLACCEAESLTSINDVFATKYDRGSLRLLVAAALDSVRLIDNIVI
ncbi:pantoate--beta-alanine ligase [Asaia bogorensis]|uniref:Pantothenate synthetase n=1 Tax=Asaia bogorensis NBRC 16594 TaxID=1231624 RepID=A0AAN4R297_9PROT|nr:pantoate--beta-alanine ligase [Asaia bogorensis]BAT18600.1 pantoate--beta-alanine ligase [Asaia bogorensis NBRC 16594]GBQ75254.1 pantoate--beta-alanine ligase [Asaia bogorensis NBRC 16594]GEL52952.1 pantothenate synthetase [Asaia bogorensis NBRC 16594]